MYHIACNIDSKYTRFCGVLMVSVFENNKDVSIKVHILGDGLTQKDKKDLHQAMATVWSFMMSMTICFSNFL